VGNEAVEAQSVSNYSQIWVVGIPFITAQPIPAAWDCGYTHVPSRSIEIVLGKHISALPTLCSKLDGPISKLMKRGVHTS
jgi:hypothetical protein